ncbi:MAG: hypothetical protein HY586_04435 [Candidatus Omnitrophica bacterium]|nr:hypothetical protein [Candidatus Omnitrophota bacterium]
MSALRSGVILFSGGSLSEKMSLATALAEALILNQHKVVVLEQNYFPLLTPEREPEWTHGVLTVAHILSEKGGCFVLLPLEMGDPTGAIGGIRESSVWFKEVYVKSSSGGAGGDSSSRKPKLPDLAVHFEENRFDFVLKQLLDWLARYGIISAHPNTAAGKFQVKEIPVEESQLIREKLKSLGYL